MAGLYIHIPFCRKICNYCDFYHSASLGLSDALFGSLLLEIEARGGEIDGSEIETIYIGGGTPSILSIEQLSQLIAKVNSVWSIGALKEFTLEANPEDLSRDYLGGLKELGISRLSIGIQSLNDDTLQFMNRSHTASEAIEAVQRAQSVGFDNISLDLIFGVPTQSIEELERGVKEIIALGAPHLSAYHLTIDSGSILYKQMQRGRFTQIEDQESQRQYQLVEKLLTQAGYCHYEVSNYAKQGHEAIHNSNYWSGEPYIGIGPSAHSFSGAQRRANVASIQRYIQGVGGGDSYFEIEELSLTDRVNETIMTSLRTAKGLDINKFSQQFGNNFTQSLLGRAAPFISSSKLHYHKEHLYIETSQFLISDYIISELFEV